MKSLSSRIVHFIPPANLEPIQREFVEPNESDHFIHWLFRYRCMECKQPGQDVNEIIPRARSKKSIHDWKNRVVLCRNCHSKFHMNGVTDTKINIMKSMRSEFLVSIGRGEYI